MLRIEEMMRPSSVNRLRVLHAALGVACLAFMGLLVAANAISGCRPEFLLRPELVAWISLAFVLAVALFWASRADDDRHRLVGSTASGAVTGLMLGTVSIPMVVVPLSIVGCFRLPRSGGARVALTVLVLLAAALAAALPYAARGLLAASEHACG